MKKIFLGGKKIALVFHEVIPVGPAHDFRDYLLSCGIKSLLFISHPLLNNRECYQKKSRYELYGQDKDSITNDAYHWKLPDVLLYIKDIIYTLYWTLSFQNNIDLFIGFDPLNALTGLILRRFGRTKSVIYYSIDYFTSRFPNRIMNRVYHALDKFCVRHADETWNLSPMMKSSRALYNNMYGFKYSRQITVPVALNYHHTKRKKFNEINKRRLLFSGNLSPIMGVELIIRAMPEIIRTIPDVFLDVVGGGPQKKKLEKLVSDFHIQRYVKFYGWVSDKDKLEKIFSVGAVGLAPFNTSLLRDEIKNADPAKIKHYVSYGMPIIMTNAPSNSSEIEKYHCGILITYDPKELAKAAIKLLKNERLLRKYREHALLYAKKFDFDIVYGKNLARLIKTGIL